MPEKTLTGKAYHNTTKHYYLLIMMNGLKSYILSKNRINGFIFFVSCVYYRSSWKYQERSLRYCFLDSGHHLGTIAASAYVHNRDIQLVFDFDKLALNQDLGFENKEFITACAFSGFQAKKTSV
ncbi:hypothetical protein [Iningainema tapete]|uniref:hypothetical protein n=1 Tax=Iningainema tapete TaxID=2806730 RepID=UPI003B587BB0